MLILNLQHFVLTSVGFAQFFCGGGEPRWQAWQAKAIAFGEMALDLRFEAVGLVGV